MKKIILLLALFSFSFQMMAQNFELPENIKLEKKKDYTKYEKEVVQAIDWLVKTPVNQEKTKRKAVSAFVFQWISGTPTVSIELSADIVTFMNSTDCLIMFMSGWTKFALQNEGETDNLKGNLAGIEMVIEFYKRNKPIFGKIKDVEKYIKLQDKGELESFIKSKL